MRSNLVLFSLLGFSIFAMLSCASVEGKLTRSPANGDVALTAEDEEEGEIQAPPFPQYQSEEQSYESAPVAGAKAYFEWPVDEAKLTRGFFAEPRKVRKSRKKRPHLGIDLAASKGTAIFAAHDGTVIYVGRAFKGFGRLIMIEGKKGWASLYAHLSKSHVYEGQKVRQGERIADMGSTGRSTGPHLHFEIRTLKGPVDPLGYLPNGALVAKLAEDGKRLKRDLAHLYDNDEDHGSN